jgi:hypothetical protein
MKRLNKEYKLDVCNHVVVKYGSVNKDNPQVVYVSGRCWVSPQMKMDYDYVISRIEKEMRKNIKLFFMDGINFDKKFILDFDINTDNFVIGDKKFLSFDFYLRQNETNKKSLKDLKNILNGKISTVVNNLVYLFKENDFTIEKRK